MPAEILRQAGVGLTRRHGDRPVQAPLRRARSELELRGRERRLAFALLVLGLFIVAALAWVGRDYYLLSRVGRLHSPAHETLRPAGVWGRGVGIAGTLFMLSNFLYPVRKTMETLVSPASGWTALTGRSPAPPATRRLNRAWNPGGGGIAESPETARGATQTFIEVR